MEQVPEDVIYFDEITGGYAVIQEHVETAQQVSEASANIVYFNEATGGYTIVDQNSIPQPEAPFCEDEVAAAPIAVAEQTYESISESASYEPVVYETYYETTYESVS